MNNNEAAKILEQEKCRFLDNYVDYGGIAKAYDKGVAALKKQTPTMITYEATLPSSPTCPCCKNVVGKREMWGDTKVQIQWRYCIYCGQALKWDEFEECAQKIKE